MKKRHIKQLIAFVAFSISAAGMDSDCNILMGAIAIVSVTYLWILYRKEQNDVYAIRRSRVNQRKGCYERPYLERYPLCNERRYKP